MEIREDGDYVVIGDSRISGFIADSSCDRCSRRLVYHDGYDAYFCPSCNEWKESGCPEPSCSFCRQRPQKPL